MEMPSLGQLLQNNNGEVQMAEAGAERDSDDASVEVEMADAADADEDIDMAEDAASVSNIDLAEKESDAGVVEADVAAQMSESTMVQESEESTQDIALESESSEVREPSQEVEAELSVSAMSRASTDDPEISFRGSSVGSDDEDIATDEDDAAQSMDDSTPLTNESHSVAEEAQSTVVEEEDTVLEEPQNGEHAQSSADVAAENAHDSTARGSISISFGIDGIPHITDNSLSSPNNMSRPSGHGVDEEPEEMAPSPSPSPEMVAPAAPPAPTAAALQMLNRIRALKGAGAAAPSSSSHAEQGAAKGSAVEHTNVEEKAFPPADFDQVSRQLQESMDTSRAEGDATSLPAISLNEFLDVAGILFPEIVRDVAEANDNGPELNQLELVFMQFMCDKLEEQVAPMSSAFEQTAIALAENNPSIFDFVRRADEKTQCLLRLHLQSLVSFSLKELKNEFAQWELKSIFEQQETQLQGHKDDLISTLDSVDAVKSLQKDLQRDAEDAGTALAEHEKLSAMREAVQEQASAVSAFEAEVAQLESELAELDQAKSQLEQARSERIANLEQSRECKQQLMAKQHVLTDLQETTELLTRFSVWQFTESSGEPDEIMALAATHPDQSQTTVRISRSGDGAVMAKATFVAAPSKPSTVVEALVDAIKCDNLLATCTTVDACLEAVQVMDVLFMRMRGVMAEIAELERRFECTCARDGNGGALVKASVSQSFSSKVNVSFRIDATYSIAAFYPAVSWNGPDSRTKDGVCNFKCSLRGQTSLVGEEGAVVRGSTRDRAAATGVPLIDRSRGLLQPEPGGGAQFGRKQGVAVRVFDDRAGAGFPTRGSVVFLGGSSTTGAGGVARPRQDAVLVVWEYAINDAGTKEYADAFRFFLQQVRNHPQRPAIILVFLWDEYPAFALPVPGQAVHANLRPLLRDALVVNVAGWVRKTCERAARRHSHGPANGNDFACASKYEFVVDVHGHPNARVHRYIAERVGALLRPAFERRHQQRMAVRRLPVLQLGTATARITDPFATMPSQSRTQSWLFDPPTLDAWPRGGGASSASAPVLTVAGKGSPERRDRQVYAHVPHRTQESF
eukprot:g3979.t1